MLAIALKSVGDFSDPKAMAKKIHDMVLRSFNSWIKIAAGAELFLCYGFNKIQHIFCRGSVGC